MYKVFVDCRPLDGWRLVAMIVMANMAASWCPLSVTAANALECLARRHDRQLGQVRGAVMSVVSLTANFFFSPPNMKLNISD